MAIINRLGKAVYDEAAAFITQLGLEPVTQSHPQGSLVERTAGLDGLDFAIVLVGADAPGALMLEIGYLLGSLGRDRLCFMVVGKPDIAELEGVVRHAMDDTGVWRLLLARQMRQAGLDVDLNRAL